MTTLLKGAEVTAKLNGELTAKTESLKAKGIFPTLAIVRVGEKDDQISYERGASARAGKIGVDIKKFTLPEDITQAELVAVIDEINSDNKIHGVLLLKPLPAGIDEDFVSNSIASEKDVDGITYSSLAGVFTGTDIGYPPCTPQACVEILDFYDLDVAGKNIAVIGRSLVVGKPVAMMLTDKNATVTICHTKTKNLAEICKRSDILVVSAGRAKLITKEHMSERHIILDVGIHADEKGKLCGDVNFEDADGFVKAITPVPGGVGGVTTSVLLKNVLSATEKLNNLK